MRPLVCSVEGPGGPDWLPESRQSPPEPMLRLRNWMPGLPARE
jgi:hypothetical protein